MPSADYLPYGFTCQFVLQHSRYLLLGYLFSARRAHWDRRRHVKFLGIAYMQPGKVANRRVVEVVWCIFLLSLDQAIGRMRS